MAKAPHTNADGFDAAVDEFERAWRSGSIPDLAAFIDGVANHVTDRRALLYELLRVDLEYRWRTSRLMESDRRTLDDYLLLLPELGRGTLPIDLIAEEYRVRRRWGSLNDPAEYFRRYPERHAELCCALADVDDEIEHEADPPPAITVSRMESLKAFNVTNIPQFPYSDFVLQSHVGSGGIGKVYRAWWKSRKMQVALKMLRKAWWRQPGAEEIFFREAAILLWLRHKSIVHVHGIGRTDKGGCFLVIALIDGGDISQYVGQQVPVMTILEWVAQAADALAYAHREGIVHRDVKPSNLLLDTSGRIHVADFGLALTPAARLGGAGGIVGTLSYMAPEQLFGGGHVGPTADIFSLGAVLHSLLHGRLPWDDGSWLDTVRRRLEYRPNVYETRGDLAPSLKSILARCLAPDPNERFANAAELVGALRAELTHTNPQ